MEKLKNGHIVGGVAVDNRRFGRVPIRHHLCDLRQSLHQLQVSQPDIDQHLSSARQTLRDLADFALLNMTPGQDTGAHSQARSELIVAARTIIRDTLRQFDQ